ncbi:anaerobic ribonucleoside-triphosphate reductase [Cupriavidus basilensis]|uniref:Anaerobic ribonucleoside-triphosphate reductase n=1 Tax=Cupriavidus basilensis TaxID=68895 RepID=A0ABT6AGN9_9BURK|nr:anaerobic ribonucleoside-triphosphate reductase [Cupriavidus basilensis]MDF3831768.1 anaerobic ribonucleoside-triphosphate reductase [Cupriavidus basilensis]
MTDQYQSSPAIQAEPGDAVLRDEERQPCEIWTRVMGYHRPVSSFNTGKQGEHRERRFFSEPRGIAA